MQPGAALQVYKQQRTQGGRARRTRQHRGQVAPLGGQQALRQVSADALGVPQHQLEAVPRPHLAVHAHRPKGLVVVGELHQRVVLGGDVRVTRQRVGRDGHPHAVVAQLLTAAAAAAAGGGL